MKENSEKLTRREEELMRCFWEHGPLFVRELVALSPDPKPHFNTLSTMVRALEAKGYTFVSADISLIPQTYVKLTSEEDVKNMEKLLDMLEDNEDVQNTYHNWETED